MWPSGDQKKKEQETNTAKEKGPQTTQVAEALLVFPKQE